MNGQMVWAIIAAVIALIGGIVLYFTFLNSKNEGRFKGFLGWMYDFLTFRKMMLEALLRICYLILVIYVTLGVVLGGLGIYQYLVEFAGAGAQLPIMSFGHSVIHGAMEKSQQLGFIGIGMGMFDLTAVGITAAILFAFLVALIFKPKG